MKMKNTDVTKIARSRKPAAVGANRKAKPAKAPPASGKTIKPAKTGATAAKSTRARRRAVVPPSTPPPAGTPASPPPSPVPEPRWTAFEQRLLDELGALRRLLQPPTAPGADDGDLESGVNALRRVLNDCLERRLESLLGRLVNLRVALTAPGERVSAGALEQLDQILAESGAVRYTPSPLDHFDPLICEAIAERNVPNAPDGVIVETLRPGFRTARGTILTKAAVAMNRKAA